MAILGQAQAAAIVETCDLIKKDAEADAKLLDGMELSGLNVGTNFGQVYASISSLAGMIAVIAEEAGRG